MKLRKKIKISTIIVFLVLTIFLFSFLMIKNFSKNISPRLIENVESKIKKESTDIVVNSFNKDILEQYDLKNIIILNKNSKEEIIAVDFNIENAYDIVLAVARNIKDGLDNLNKNQDNKDYIILVPMGIGANNVYLANLGPKIPVKIDFIETLSTSLYTKVKSYGINNSLIEVYMKVILKEEILIPFTSKKVNNECEILLSSQIVEGIVPSIYNGLIEQNSSLINVPLS